MIRFTLCTGHLRQFVSLYSVTSRNVLPSLFVNKEVLPLLVDFSATTKL